MLRMPIRVYSAKTPSIRALMARAQPALQIALHAKAARYVLDAAQDSHWLRALPKDHA